MNGIECYDSSGVRMKYLYQWDAEQVVKICGVDTDIELEVQFCSIDSTEALVVSHSIDGADIVANVPNILLQRPVPVMVYVCHSPKDGASRTIGAARITVVPKVKPVNYVYTETEVLNYRFLDAQMTELRNSIELLEDKIPTKLPNPHPLTINGQSYDGSNPVNISVESNTQGGGAVSSDEIKLAVDSYMSEHPVSFEETDPTVPAWAKQPNKPTYTAAEVGAMPADTMIPDGGIPIPNTASVGQTVVVKAVDENGKPTEWEATDFPVGGDSSGWKLVANVTVEEDVERLTIETDTDGKSLSEFGYGELYVRYKLVGLGTGNYTSRYSNLLIHFCGGYPGGCNASFANLGNGYDSIEASVYAIFPKQIDDANVATTGVAIHGQGLIKSFKINKGVLASANFQTDAGIKAGSQIVVYGR